MPLKNYEELDEDDFYGQGFEKEGVVSLWVGTSKPGTYPPKVDVLQDLCGVGYYSLDQQEVIVEDKAAPVNELVAKLAYSSSFAKAVDKALAKAPKGKFGPSHWVVAQYDFAYNPKRVKRKIKDDPLFLGFFPWNDDEDDDL